jgi:diguanylate cyclase (GGDEF)-like protein
MDRIENDVFLREMRAAARDPLRWAFLAGARLLGVRRASLLLREGEEPVLTVYAALGIEATVVPTIRVQVGQGIDGLAAERNMTLVGTTGNTRYICVPISTPRGVAGVIDFTNRLEDPEFGDDEIALARSVADHVAYLLRFTEEAALDLAPGLPDRRALREMIERELERSRRTGRPFILILLGVPQISVTRNRAGDDQATDLLQQVAEILPTSIRRYDFVSYFGNDTFALLISDAEGMADRIVTRAVDRVGKIVKNIDGIGAIAVGLAHCPADGVRADELIGRALERLQEQISQTV